MKCERLGGRLGQVETRRPRWGGRRCRDSAIAAEPWVSFEPFVGRSEVPAERRRNGTLEFEPGGAHCVEAERLRKGERWAKGAGLVPRRRDL